MVNFINFHYCFYFIFKWNTDSKTGIENKIKIIFYWYIEVEYFYISNELLNPYTFRLHIQKILENYFF